MQQAQSHLNKLFGEKNLNKNKTNPILSKYLKSKQCGSSHQEKILHILGEKASPNKRHQALYHQHSFSWPPHDP